MCNCDSNNYNCIVDFFKSINLYDAEYFKKIKEKTIILNGNYIEIKNFIGYYPKYEKNQLVDFKLYLPELIGLENILIYIHQYGYALFPDDESQIFPNILEVLFLNTYLKIPTKTNEIIEKIEHNIKESNNIEYNINQRIKINCLKYLK